MPRLAVSLIIENNKHEILLARRAIPPEKGLWHMPGSFVLKGESLEKCIKRISQEELGLKVNAKSALLMGTFDDLHKDPRGHVVDIIYKLKTTIVPRSAKGTKEITFFSKLPSPIGFNHRDTLHSLGYA